LKRFPGFRLESYRSLRASYSGLDGVVDSFVTPELTG
jgi:hypothetical protein